MNCDLRPIVLCSRQRLIRRNVQAVIAVVTLIRSVAAVIERVNEFVAAGHSVNVLLGFDAGQKRIVVGVIVHDVRRMMTERGCHHIGEGSIRRRHVLLSSD